MSVKVESFSPKVALESKADFGRFWKVPGERRVSPAETQWLSTGQRCGRESQLWRGENGCFSCEHAKFQLIQMLKIKWSSPARNALDFLWHSEGKWKLILEFIINPLKFKHPWFKSLFYFILIINNFIFPVNIWKFTMFLRLVFLSNFLKFVWNFSIALRLTDCLYKKIMK